MTRNAVIVIFVCALAGAIFYAWKFGADRSRPVVLKDTGTVVYAARDIAKGAGITGYDVEEKQIFVEHMPGTACWSKWQAVGRKASHSKRPGELVDLYDLDPNPFKTVVQAARDIPQGATIEAQDLNEHARTNETPEAAMDTTYVVQGRAKNAIKKGQYFRLSDVAPGPR